MKNVVLILYLYLKYVYIKNIINCIHYFICKTMIPLSKCTQGRITRFNGYEMVHADLVYLKCMGVGSNEDNYNNAEKCWIYYEVVGTKGAFALFMVYSYCPKEGNEGIRGGDMLHFDLHKNGFNTNVDEGLGIMNMTFHMVAYPHKGNIIVKTRPIISEIYFGFFVINYV